MGNWSPNFTPMYDDATHGDALAGDNLWSSSTSPIRSATPASCTRATR
jgi:hypothetical protein